MKNHLSASQAFEYARKNKHRITAKLATADGLMDIPWQAKFMLPERSYFFTIGSCFARNVERYLLARKMNLLSQMPPLPDEYYVANGKALRTGYQNVYTPASMLEVAKMAAGEVEEQTIVGAGSQYIDLMLSGLHPLPLETVKSIRHGLVTSYRKLAEADAVLITLGYNEAWFHKPSGCYINRTPAHPILRKMDADFEFAILDYGQAHAMLSEAVSRLRALSPNLRIIFTVSPVPLSATFSDKHIVVANQRSKATLLAVAHQLADEQPFVDYFPSYEIIINSERAKVFMDDGIHVLPAGIEQVMKAFFASYIGDKA